MSGRRVDANGYVRLFRDGESLYEHRVVWEEHFGAIPDGFHVHHKNHDRSDNRPENLEVVEGREHNRRHTTHRHRTRSLDARLSLSARWLDLDSDYIIRRRTEGASYRQIGREIGRDHHVVKRHYIEATEGVNG